MFGRGCRVALAALLSVVARAGAEQTAGPPAGRLTAEQVMARVAERNRQRTELLESYSVRRLYRVANELTEKSSELEVEVVFTSPDRLDSHTLRQSGSRFLAKNVLERMIEAEREALAPDQRRRSALTEENYEFALLGEERVESRRAYVIGLRPKREDTYLLAGRVWVDAEDFATMRAAGSPAKRPSFWTRKVDLLRGYRKVGPFWLPDRLETVTEVLLFGETTASIESRDYRIRLRPAAPH